MGGRGARSGAAKLSYGSEFKRVFQHDNIKFVVTAAGQNTTAPMETKTDGRVYVTLDYKNEPKFISFYDDNGMRYKQIDLSGKGHMIDGEFVPPPHVHFGYNHDENGSAKVTADDIKFIERVKTIWSSNMASK